MFRPGGNNKAAKPLRMKTFLVIAGLLMTGASVYGVIDYNKTAGSNEFKDLYKEMPEEKAVVEKQAAMPLVEKKETPKTVDAVKTETAPKKKAVKKKAPRKLQLKKFSREALG